MITPMHLPDESPAPIPALVHGTCRWCDAPAASGGLCRVHYFLQAVNGQGKWYCTLAQRPGKWVPPIILVATVVGMFLTVGALTLYFCFIIPLVMFGFVFGTKRNPKRDDPNHKYFG